jgi:hypothetical protein
MGMLDGCLKLGLLKEVIRLHGGTDSLSALLAAASTEFFLT